VVDTYSVGDELEGTVTKVVAFGAFVEIMNGVEGLVHISELAQQHVENPREIVQPGDDIKVKILEIDSERRRLSLSIKRVEDQVLPRRPIADAGDLDDMPELGLSEDVFATAPDVEPADVAAEVDLGAEPVDVAAELEAEEAEEAAEIDEAPADEQAPVVEEDAPAEAEAPADAGEAAPAGSSDDA
jgi:small subunit ribosomal protein S1